jgi:hypothetical protein
MKLSTLKEKLVINRIVGNLTTGSKAITGTDLDDYIAPVGGTNFIDGKDKNITRGMNG